MVSQGLYWQEKAEAAGSEWFYVTAEDWYDQTGVTVEMQATARKLLKSFGFWSERRFGIPAKMHYKIDMDALVTVIYRYLETGISLSVDNRSKKRELTRTSSGKFRQLDTVKNRNKKNKEIKETSEREHTREILPNVSSTLDTPFPPSPQVPPAPPSPVNPWQPVDPAAELQIMLTDEACKARFFQQCRIPLDQYQSYLEGFRLKVNAEQAIHNNRRDFRSHFFSWATIQHSKKPVADNGAYAPRRPLKTA